MEMKKIKGISKAIYIISKISLVFIAIAGIGITIAMTASPILISNTEITDSSINFFDNEYSYSVEEGEITIDDNVINYSLQEKINSVGEYFEEDNKTETIIFTEVILAISLASVVLLYLAILNLYKLFKNIHDEETPFNEKNVSHIKAISRYIVISLVVMIISGFIMDIFTGLPVTYRFNFTGILSVLIIYALSFIFEYGYKLQLEVDSTL